MRPHVNLGHEKAAPQGSSACTGLDVLPLQLLPLWLAAAAALMLQLLMLPMLLLMLLLLLLLLLMLPLMQAVAMQYKSLSSLLAAYNNPAKCAPRSPAASSNLLPRHPGRALLAWLAPALPAACCVEVAGVQAACPPSVQLPAPQQPQAAPMQLQSRPRAALWPQLRSHPAAAERRPRDVVRRTEAERRKLLVGLGLHGGTRSIGGCMSGKLFSLLTADDPHVQLSNT
jgi:hypothetical protein